MGRIDGFPKQDLLPTHLSPTYTLPYHAHFTYPPTLMPEKFQTAALWSSTYGHTKTMGTLPLHHNFPCYQYI